MLKQLRSNKVMFLVLFSLAISKSVARGRRELQGDKSLTIDWSSFVPGHGDRDAPWHDIYQGIEWPGRPHRVTRRCRSSHQTMTNKVVEKPDARGGTQERTVTTVTDDSWRQLRGSQATSNGTEQPLAGMDLSLAFRETIKRSGLYVHCEMFQKIADCNGGIRAAGSAAYSASVAYVIEKLKDAGYNVYTTDVEADYFEEVLPPTLEGPMEYTSLSDDEMALYTFPGSASGMVEAPIYVLDVVYHNMTEVENATSGCDLEDFVDFPAGNIALMRVGSCSFLLMAYNAFVANASAIIFTFDDIHDAEQGKEISYVGNIPMPIVYSSSMLGMSILDALANGDVTATWKMTTDVIAAPRINKNVIAETDYGDDSKVIMIGAHLDSVMEGPGIQDNTSGSSAALELALQFKKHGWDSEQTLKNKIRFAWWAAEELGLKGSTQYVKDLSDTEIANIAMYLNMDMIGSPNYVRLVFDGDGSNSSLLEPNLKPGTPMAHIEATYHQYFDQVGLPVAQEPLEYAYGSTDHTAFYDAGIPISDLFTGHYLPKTEEQAAIFGGKAGEPWDPCYHQACDTIDNVNFMVMEEMARAAAHALAMYGSKDGDLFA